MSEIKGLDSLLAKLDRLDETMLERLAPKVVRSLESVVADATANCPSDDGQLRRSITASAEVRGNEIYAKVAASAEYAVFVEMGTGPRGEANHAGVSPKAIPKVTYSPTGWKCHFVGKDGEEHFWSNGQAARPFLYPAFKGQEKDVEDHIKEAIKEVTREVCSE